MNIYVNLLFHLKTQTHKRSIINILTHTRGLPKQNKKIKYK